MSRRYRLLASFVIATVLLMLLVRRHSYGYDTLNIPGAGLSTTWLRPDAYKAATPQSETIKLEPQEQKTLYRPQHTPPAEIHKGYVEPTKPAVATSTSPPPTVAAPEETKPIEPVPPHASDPEAVEVLGDKEKYYKQIINEPTDKAGKLESAIEEADVDWTRFAYMQYVTNRDYLCNSVMVFETLHRLGARADRVMMYPSNMMEDATQAKAGPGEYEASLLIQARDQYRVKLKPIQIQYRESYEETWADSFTKLLAFNQTQYDRVLSLDSDGIVLEPMDELFLTPSCPVAMPRAYWLLHNDPPQRVLSSQIMLVEPSVTEFERIQARISTASDNEYDMEVVNQLYFDSAMILPHRKYDMLTAEFRGEDHSAYLGSDKDKWDPIAAYNEAKFMHFSDWPVPKPWVPMEPDVRAEMQPKCKEVDGVESCLERDMWNGFYNDYAKQRNRVCFEYEDPAEKVPAHARRR